MNLRIRGALPAAVGAPAQPHGYGLAQSERFGGNSVLPLIDARTLESGVQLAADVCIVGAGAAGTTLAESLVQAGAQVLLVESGGFAPDEAVQSLYDLDSVGYPMRPNYMSRARYLGGSCNLWAGRCMHLWPSDFAERSWVPDSAWPIDQSEIDPHLPAASRVLGLPPLAEHALENHDRRLTPAERRLLAEPDMSPTMSIWAPKPKRFVAALERLSASPKATVLHDASITGLHLDEAGRSISHVTAKTLCGRSLKLVGRHVVLACGGLETPRLLLASCDRQPVGLGNGHDLVGRYFMDHPRAAYGRVRIQAGERLRLMRGWPLARGKVQLGLAASPKLQAEAGLLNHYLTLEATHSDYVARRYQETVEVGKVLLRRGHAGSRLDLGRAKGAPRLEDFIYFLSPKEILPHWLWRATTVTRHALPQPKSEQTYVIVYFCEQPPEPNSRVYLGDATDRLGMPRLVLDWRIPASVDDSVKQLESLLARSLEQNGLGRLEPGDGRPDYTDASHQMGTTRMSQSPRRGVVDPDCRVHGLENLYVAGSAVFPSAGHANPTLTIVALALRLGRHLEQRLQASGA